MAKHRAISQHSLQARTVIGGVVASGALLVGAPAGMALASPNGHHWNSDKNQESTKPAADTTSSGASTNLAAPISKENQILTKLTLSIFAKAQTDPGLAKVLTKVAPFAPKCLTSALVIGHTTCK